MFLLAILLFSGCSNNTPITTTTVPSEDMRPSIVMKHISISDYNEYLTFISDKNSLLPEAFISYKNLEFIGEFISFDFTRNPSSSYYGYTLEDSNDIQIRVIHRFTKTIDSQKESLTLEEAPCENIADLSRHPSGDACYVTIYGIQYHYDLDGNLTQLTWFNNNQWDMTFSFPENFSLDNCQETILSQLLNADTAQAAAEKLLSIGAKN